MPEFKITIGHAEFFKSGGYMDVFNCPIAVKLKSLFPGRHVSVGGTNAHIGQFIGIEFDTSNWKAHIVDSLTTKAQDGEHVSQTFEITFPNFPQELLDLLNPEEVQS